MREHSREARNFRIDYRFRKVAYSLCTLLYLLAITISNKIRDLKSQILFSNIRYFYHVISATLAGFGFLSGPSFRLTSFREP